MPLDTIYLTRHGHRLNWTIDFRTGTYKAQFPTPTGNPADPALTSHGVRQSHELAEHIAAPQFHPKPFRVYSSPFYRCLQTIQPSVEELKRISTQPGDGQQNGTGAIDQCVDLNVRIENGLGEWFGATNFFDHPAHPTPEEMSTHFPTLIPETSLPNYKPHVIPSRRGETISQLHNRVAVALQGIINDIDTEINALEASLPADQRTSKSILICAHAAPLIAMGRALTGRMPDDSSEEDFNVFTAGLSTYKRREKVTLNGQGGGPGPQGESALAEGTKLIRASGDVPAWRGGNGVGGGWDCVSNGDCSFLSTGAERGWHFNGEESFDTGPMAPASEPAPVKTGTKL